jgi:hypothetical protein
LNRRKAFSKDSSSRTLTTVMVYLITTFFNQWVEIFDYNTIRYGINQYQSIETLILNIQIDLICIQAFHPNHKMDM